jgi:protein-S-isoprenylcysteine O-methyltransferase Ste14
MTTFLPWLHLVPWALWFGYWVWSARKLPRVVRTEALPGRIAHLTVLVLSFAMGVFRLLAFGPLGWTFLPPSAIWIPVGLLVTVAGLGMAVWARVHLGASWSGRVGIRSDQKLVRSGPYALVRHPIYTGVVTAFLGTAICGGQVQGLLAAGMMLVSYVVKIRIEERLLVEHFGDEYRVYQREVKALVPTIF